MRKVHTMIWQGILHKLADEWTDKDTGELMSWKNIDKKTRKYFEKAEFNHLREEVIQYKKEKKNGTTIK